MVLNLGSLCLHGLGLAILFRLVCAGTFSERPSRSNAPPESRATSLSLGSPLWAEWFFVHRICWRLFSARRRNKVTLPTNDWLAQALAGCVASRLCSYPEGPWTFRSEESDRHGIFWLCQESILKSQVQIVQKQASAFFYLLGMAALQCRMNSSLPQILFPFWRSRCCVILGKLSIVSEPVFPTGSGERISTA